MRGERTILHENSKILRNRIVDWEQSFKEKEKMSYHRQLYFWHATLFPNIFNSQHKINAQTDQLLAHSVFLVSLYNWFSIIPGGIYVVSNTYSSKFITKHCACVEHIQPVSILFKILQWDSYLHRIYIILELFVI